MKWIKAILFPDYCDMKRGWGKERFETNGKKD
jgi:hypothetical protein